MYVRWSPLSFSKVHSVCIYCMFRVPQPDPNLFSLVVFFFSQFCPFFIVFSSLLNDEICLILSHYCQNESFWQYLLVGKKRNTHVEVCSRDQQPETYDISNGKHEET